MLKDSDDVLIFMVFKFLNSMVILPECRSTAKSTDFLQIIFWKVQISTYFFMYIYIIFKQISGNTAPPHLPVIFSYIRR